MFNPCPKPAMAQIVQISFMVERLTLEGYCSVSLQEVTEYNQANQPLNNVPKIEWQDQHLNLLVRMNPLMIEHNLIDHSPFAHKYDPKQIQSIESFERYNTVEDYHSALNLSYHFLAVMDIELTRLQQLDWSSHQIERHRLCILRSRIV